MDPKVKKELEQEEPTKFHKKMLEHVRGLIKMSRDSISQYYDDWDRADDNYRGRKTLDKEDRENDREGKPVKLVLSLSFAQIQTWVSFEFLLMTQNRTFFELKPTGGEDFKVRPDAELVLDRDVQHNGLDSAVLYQQLLDTGRFGLSILENSWTELYAYFLPSQVPRPPEQDFIEDMQVTEGMAEQAVDDDGEPVKILRFQGNVTQNCSPYRWLPDPRFTFSQFQKGEFCGHEEDIARVSLRQLEQDGEVAGIDRLPELTNKMLDNLGNVRIGYNRNSQQSGPNKGRKGVVSAVTSTPNESIGVDLLSKMQVKIVPNDYTLSDGTKMGKEKWPVLYYVWVANDSRVVRCEPAKVLHGQFGYSVTEFTPDMHQQANEGLPDMIDKIQTTATWFINSHVRAVNRVNGNRIVADPGGVDVASLTSDDPVILLKSGASKTGVDRWVKQLQVQDTTTNHMNDVEILSKMSQMITGVNDNAQGQYNSGRRSATEARAVTSGAAGRMKVTGTVIWKNGYVPIGRQMLTNSRAGLGFETFARIVGRPDPENPLEVAKIAERYKNFRGTIDDLVGGDDFFVFDSTLSSEKGFVAQSLQELLQVMLTNPVVSQILDIDIKALFEEMMYLRGTTNIDRFSLSKNVQAGTTPQPPPPQLTAPGEQQQQPGNVTQIPQVA